MSPNVNYRTQPSVVYQKSVCRLEARSGKVTSPS